MIYATLSDMQKRYSRLDLLMERTDDGEPDYSPVDLALADASSLIEGYISARYTLPLSVVPDTLNLQCCVIAWFLMCTEQATEQATRRYSDAMKWLVAVRDGDVPLGVDQDAAAPQTESLVEMVSDPSVFSRRQRGFI